MEKIAIIGASGFVGRRLIKYLAKNFPDYELVGLSRSEPRVEEKITWRQCDLFSLLDIENGLQDCDVAIYLVHSMGPSAHLDQGNFADYDLIIGDNFIRACKKNKINQIIYLGGILPKDTLELSAHLKSRLEIEEVMKSSLIPLTIFRAGMIIGPEGSSFNIMTSLIHRLPIMGLPTWTKTETQTVDINYICQCIGKSINNEKHFNKVYEVATSEVLTYEKMLKITAKLLNKKRYFVTVPIISRGLSKLWISLISGAPRSLTYPLVEGLNHKIIANPEMAFDNPKLDFEETLKQCLSNQETGKPHAFKKAKKKKNNEVRSVQRLILPKEMRAHDVAYEYMKWLPVFLNSFIRVDVYDEKITFKLWPFNINLLVLSHSIDRSSTDRQLFYIIGGVLSQKTKRGRLEFREAMDGKYIIAAIHEFRPSLPWFIYCQTQAPIHLAVMNQFQKWLEEIDEKNSEFSQHKEEFIAKTKTP